MSHNYKQNSIEKMLSPTKMNRENLTCSSCSNELILTQGDILYDAKWYHKRCWESINGQFGVKIGIDYRVHNAQIG